MSDAISEVLDAATPISAVHTIPTGTTGQATMFVSDVEGEPSFDADTRAGVRFEVSEPGPSPRWTVPGIHAAHHTSGRANLDVLGPALVRAVLVNPGDVKVKVSLKV